MKTIKYILVSYTQMEFIHLFNFALGIVYFIVGSLKVFAGTDGFHDDFFSTWHFFLLALIMVASQLVTQTQRLIKFNSGNLIPDKMSYYFLAAGIVYFPFFALPVFSVIYLGLPILPHISMLLIITGTILVFNEMPFANNKSKRKGGKNTMLLGLGIIIGSYVLLGFPLGKGLDSQFPKLIRFIRDHNLSPIILLSALWFFHRAKILYSKLRISDTAYGENSGSDPMNRTRYDEANPGVLKLAETKLIGSLKKAATDSLTVLRQAELFQYSLFNPRISVWIYTLLVLVLAVNGIVYLLSIMMSERFSGVLLYMLPPSVITLVAYYSDAARLSLEFLQHRNRLAMLRHQSRYDSRKKFAVIVLFSYLYAAIKRFITLTLVIMIVRFIFPDFFYIKLSSIPVVLASGLLVYMIVISISLILSDDIRSANCVGWNIGTIISAFAVWKVLQQYWHYGPEIYLSWILILGIGAITGVLLLHALKCLSGSELDFASPEQLI